MAPLTIDDLRNLPPTVDLMTAARTLGIRRTKAYELARAGQFPCRIIRIGTYTASPPPNSSDSSAYRPTTTTSHPKTTETHEAP